MSWILRDQPPPLSEVRPDLPRHLGRILRRCLEKDPRDRYQSARSICNELRSLRIETTDAGSASSADGRRVQLYERPWILVTGFKVSGTDPEMGDFAEGLAEDITAGLSRFGYLSVVARESALTGSDRSVGEMRDGVGARYLIEGSVRKAGSIVRVGVRLVDSRTGAHLWAETYTRDMSALDIFSVQDDITGRVVATVADGYGVLVRSMIDAIETKLDTNLDVAVSTRATRGQARRIEDAVAAVEAAMERDKYLCVIAQKEPETEEPAPDDLYTYGTVIKVLQVIRTPDETLKILIEGMARGVEEVDAAAVAAVLEDDFATAGTTPRKEGALLGARKK